MKNKKVITSLLVTALTMGQLSSLTTFPIMALKNADPIVDKLTANSEVNLARDRGSTARASKYLPTSSNNPAREPRFAFDGISSNITTESNNSRWQSGEDATFSDQWLEVDLGGTCLVSSINVDFFAKLYGDFRIEVANSNSKDATWETIKSVTMPASDDKDIKKVVDVRENGKAREIPRYLRLYFTSGNPNAANRSIGVRELQVMGTKKSESGYETITGNIALNKKATASGTEAAMPSLTPNLAVDGKKTATTRWSAPTMKSGNNIAQKQTPQWLELDLRNEVTNITSIDLYFHLLVYSIDYEIQTRADTTAEWKTVKHVTCQPGNERNKHDKIIDVTKLDRYVRFYFNKVNTSAGGNSVSLLEVEINGDQIQTPEVTNPSPENAKEAIDAVRSLQNITVTDTIVKLPKMPEGFSIHVKGSEYPQVISDDGKISEHNMYDYDMDIILEVVNDADATDRAEKTFQVHVPNKKAKHANLYPSISNPNDEPEVIPSLQEWYGYTGKVKLSKDSKIIVKDNANLGLNKIAKQFQEDMKEITGMQLTIVDNVPSDSNDIVIESLSKDIYDTKSEGYLLKADDNGIHISSAGYSGCLYGTKTLEQVFYTQKRDFTFPKGITRDFSQYDVRGVMVDIARVPYRLDALKDLVKTFSFYKINEIHFHLNDNRHSSEQRESVRKEYSHWDNFKGMFRLESKTFPSLVTDPQDNAYYNDKTGYYGGEPNYTIEEYQELQNLAKDYGMNPISEIDAPGHSLLFNRYVRNHLDEIRQVPGFENMPVDGIKSDRDWELLSLKGESGAWAMKFLKVLYAEYLNEQNPVFLGDTVHIGVDEYWNIKNDEVNGIHNYMKEMSKTVKDSNRKVRMWASLKQYCDQKQISTAPYKDIELDIWASMWDNAEKRSREGFKIVNVDSPHLYGNTGRDHRDIVNVEHIFNNWSPTTFQNGGTVQPADPNLLGAKTAMWADVADMGVTERDNMERLMRQAAILSEKTWGGTDNDQTFEDYSFKFEKLKTGPGVTLASDIPSHTGLVLDYDFKNVKNNIISDASGNGYNGTIKNGTVIEENGKNWLDLNGNGSITTNLRSIDYPYTIQFNLKTDTNNSGQLFDGRDGRLSLENGKLKINRSYFEKSFNQNITNNQEVNITIVGTQQVTKLYINGALKQALTRTQKSETDYEHRLSTFIFPLTTIGKGLDGKIADLKVYNKALSPQIIKDIADGKTITNVNVAQDKAAAGTAQRKGDTGQDADWKKLRVGWKAIDGDGNTLEGTNSTDVTEKDSYFEGAYADSKFAVDMLKNQKISKIVLQWDRAPKQFKIQKSLDGKTWSDIDIYNGQAVNKIEFNKPISTRYLRMQSISLNNNQTFKLREFEAYEVTNKDTLKQTLSTANQKLIEYGIKYGTDEYATFFDAYKKAEAMYENALAQQNDINIQNENLLAAIDTLKKPVEVDKSKLHAFYNRVNGIEEDKYLPNTWIGFKTALGTAKGILDNTNTSQEAVDNVYQTLVKAFLDLRLKPNKAALEALIDKAKSLNDSKLAQAIAQAEAVVANESATEVQVKGAYATLEVAIKGLDTCNKAVVNDDKVVANGNKAIATGDNNAITSMMALIGLSLVGLFANKKSKLTIKKN